LASKHRYIISVRTPKLRRVLALIHSLERATNLHCHTAHAWSPPGNVSQNPPYLPQIPEITLKSEQCDENWHSPRLKSASGMSHSPNGVPVPPPGRRDGINVLTPISKFSHNRIASVDASTIEPPGTFFPRKCPNLKYCQLRCAGHRPTPFIAFPQKR
jgi:hypothetical protein